MDKRDTFDDPQIQVVSDRLAAKFSEEGGFLTPEEVDDVVRDSADSLQDAPVQTFVPLIAEHKASGRLRELTCERERSGSH